MKTSIMKKSLLDYAIKGKLSAKFRRENPTLSAFDEITTYNAQIAKTRKEKQKALQNLEKSLKQKSPCVYCHTEGVARSIQNDLSCHTEALAEVSHKTEQSRDISPTAQYDKESPVSSLRDLPLGLRGNLADKQAIKSQIQALKKEIAKLKEIQILNPHNTVIASEQGERGNLVDSLANQGDCHESLRDSRNDKEATPCHTERSEVSKSKKVCHTEGVARSISNQESRDSSVASLPQYDNVACHTELSQESEVSQILNGRDSSLRASHSAQNDKIHDFPFEIPKSWAWVKLGDICEISSGESITPNNQSPVIARERSDRSNPQNHTQQIDCHDFASQNLAMTTTTRDCHESATFDKVADSRNDKLPILDVKYLRNKVAKTYANSGNMVCKNDRLILMDGENSGEVFLANENGFLGSTLKKLDYSAVIKIVFADFLLLHYKDFFKNNKKGAAIPHLDRKLFANLKVPLPPKPEQESIAKELDALFSLSKGLGVE